LVFHLSTIAMMHGPINIRFTMGCPLLKLKKETHTLIQDHLIYRKGRIKSILHHQLTRTIIKY